MSPKDKRDHDPVRHVRPRAMVVPSDGGTRRAGLWRVLARYGGMVAA